MKRLGPAVCLFVVLALLSIGGLLSRGQTTGGAADPALQGLESQIDAFFDTVAQGQVEDAFDALLLDSSQLKRASSMADLRERAGNLDQRFGKYRGHEEVSSRRVGQDVVIFTYLYKCENFPVVWHFTYYRPPRVDQMAPMPAWRLITLRFDTQVEQLELLNDRA